MTSQDDELNMTNRELIVNSDQVSCGRRPLYVQFGCGFCVGEGWLNFDSSPTLRIERLPLIGRVFGKMAGNSQPFPSEVRYGDIVRGLPVPSNSVKGVYASHVLEHLSYEDFQIALRNTFDMLEPGGRFRLIVPGLQERAERYLTQITTGSPQAAVEFMRETLLGQEKRPRSLMDKTRALFGNSHHLWMWDDASLGYHLKLAGFVGVHRCSMGDSSDPMFAKVEDAGRFRDLDLGINELAMEGCKPIS